MAKGKNKKGFGSYLLVLFLAIVATFLIIITVMLFSPFNNILGFEYFTYNQDQTILTETGGNEASPFNFENSKININCSFARVKVERSNKIDAYAFRFENYSSGFAREDQDTEFSYEVYYSEGSKSEINVDVHEPEGFLFFNKNIIVSILISTKLDQNVLSSSKVNVTNTTGNVYIGNKDKILNVEDQTKNYITLGDLNVKTNKGKIIIFPYVNETIKNLFLKTQKGNIEVKRNLNITDNFELYAEGGEFDFKELVVSNANPAVFDLGDGELFAESIQANVQLSIKDGYIDIDKFSGSLSSNDAVDQMKQANISIVEFTGALSLPYVNKSKVTLGTVNQGSEIYIHATEGNINIKDSKADVTKIETTKGNIKVQTSGKDIDVKTNSGDIDITFESINISNQIDLKSKSGDIKFNVKPEFAFLLKVFNSKGEARTDGNVKVEGFDVLESNELQINGGSSKVVNISTNGNIKVSLF